MKRWAVVLNAGAEEQVDEIQRWWLKHRRAAPLLFLNELSDALTLLELIPESGTHIVHADFEELRRILMKRTKHHLYYVVDRDRHKVRIIAVWSARRGSPPELG